MAFETWQRVHHTRLAHSLGANQFEVCGEDVAFWHCSALHRRSGSSHGSGAGSRVLISYEEYHPYGSTSWHAGDWSEVSQKRYRYTGKEKDDETGLYYHGARYYAPWLGRWVSADPSGTTDGINRYAYCRGAPICMRDSTGQATTPGPMEKAVLAGLDSYLTQRGIEFATEVKIAVQDPATGKWIHGIADRLLVIDGEAVFVEGKRVADSTRTAAQKQYLPLLEAGADVVVTGHKADTLGFPQGTTIKGRPGLFGGIVHSDNLAEWKRAMFGSAPDSGTSSQRRPGTSGASMADDAARAVGAVEEVAEVAEATPRRRYLAYEGAGSKARSVSLGLLGIVGTIGLGYLAEGYEDTEAEIARIRRDPNPSPDDVKFMESYGFAYEVDVDAGTASFAPTLGGIPGFLKRDWVMRANEAVKAFTFDWDTWYEAANPSPEPETL